MVCLYRILISYDCYLKFHTEDVYNMKYFEVSCIKKFSDAVYFIKNLNVKQNKTEPRAMIININCRINIPTKLDYNMALNSTR